EKLGIPDRKSVGVYIGIPFCPTRCSYCSFTSNQKPDSEILRYLEALKKEITFVGKNIAQKGLFIESVYIGGGTPTTLNEEELKDLLSHIFTSFDLSECQEFTVEAGRPDTITKGKLDIIKSFGIKRISINPQTMKDDTLKLIGRNHTSEEILKAFSYAKEAGIEIINCDLITGLPEETLDDFKNTLDKVFELDPMNITVHTLAIKRASRLIEEDRDYSYREGQKVKDMLEFGNEELRKHGFRPYYLYRQKHMTGSFENVGWCKEDTLSIYNIRIMEERQHILALGAGGISKIYFPDENRLERVPNVSNYEVYIDRLDEMLKRKQDNFFDLLK
ncbi:MAG: coproporphyrinogen dehydrogenase HemZ, partial [Clostridia bacterium]|nr:coproporphyrinogen dehydrogenase HemZ [Clostridia bacterium]